MYLKGTTVAQPPKPPITETKNVQKTNSNDEHKSVKSTPTAPPRRKSKTVRNFSSHNSFAVSLCMGLYVYHYNTQKVVEYNLAIY